MLGRRLLILMLVLQLAGWWWLHTQFPYLGVDSHLSVWHGAERTILFMSLDATPVHKEEYLRFDLINHAWQSLNRRQMFSGEAEFRHVPTFWQLISPRGDRQNYSAELFDRQSLAVLKRRQLPFSDHYLNAADAPRIVGNRWVIQITTTTIDWLDLDAESLTVRTLPRIPPRQFSCLFIAMDGAASPAVWPAHSMLHTFPSQPTRAELYRMDTDGQLHFISQWNIAELTQSAVTWQDRIATIETGRSQIEVRSQIDGQLLWRTELPVGSNVVDWVPRYGAVSEPVFRVGNGGRSTFYDIESGAYLAQPPGALDLVDSLPGQPTADV